MATGEGKTLAAVAPVFLHALAGRGAHVLTFNDYLARRDAVAAIEPFVVRPRAMGALPGLDYSNIEELLEVAEGPGHR